jgi:uncharacterized membrane protein
MATAGTAVASVVLATATATASGGTVGVSSRWTFGTVVVWVAVVVLVVYVLYRRFGYRPP